MYFGLDCNDDLHATATLHYLKTFQDIRCDGLSVSPLVQGKVGHWTRAYHLKVPPPPMAPQPTRGGPRHRCQPTPRGVNMIVWSLDNRFVLAAIMGK